MDDSPAAPTFKVIVETTNRWGGFGGWLTVYQGLLLVAPTRPTQRLLGMSQLQQHARTVRWVHQPLFPPWLNRAIDFASDDGPIVRLRLGQAARKQLRPTLLAAGFEIVDDRSWSIIFGP